MESFFFDIETCGAYPDFETFEIEDSRGASLFKNKLNYNTVYVEDLTYFIMINIFKDLGFKIKSFNLKKLDCLEEELKQKQQMNNAHF